MNERKIIFRVLSGSFAVLVAAFIFLFVYVDIQWWDMKTLAINPVHTVIATCIMLLVGVSVYVARNRKK